MTWTCPSWPTNVIVADLDPEGVDFDELQEANNCRTYDAMIAVTVDANGIYELSGEVEDTTCAVHGDEADWDDPPTIHIFHYICDECSLVFPTEAAASRHDSALHQAPTEQYAFAPRHTGPPPIEPLHRPDIDICTVGPNNELLTYPPDREEAIRRNQQRINQVLSNASEVLRRTGAMPLLLVHREAVDVMFATGPYDQHTMDISWPSFYRFAIQYLTVPSTHQRWRG